MLVQDEQIIPMLEYQAKNNKKRLNEIRRQKGQAKKSSCSLRIIPSWLRHFFGAALFYPTQRSDTRTPGRSLKCKHDQCFIPVSAQASKGRQQATEHTRHTHERTHTHKTHITFFLHFSLSDYPRYGLWCLAIGKQ
jgi:hypothetical protein